MSSRHSDRPLQILTEGGGFVADVHRGLLHSHQLTPEARSIIAGQGRIPHATHKRKVRVALPLAREAAPNQNKRPKGGLKNSRGLLSHLPSPHNGRAPAPAGV